MLTGTLPQVSNRSTFELLLEILDTETGEPILLDPDEMIIICALRPVGDETPTLVASSEGGTTGEINVIDLGVLQVLFPVSAMRVCAPVNYDIGLTIQVDEEVCEPFVGGISVIHGVVA